MPTSPMPSLSSGTNESLTPRSLISTGDFCIRSTSASPLFGSKYKISPPAVFCSPAMASSNSLCPLPAIPAIPSISPERAVNDTSSSAFMPSRFKTVRFLTTSLSLTFSGSALSMFSSIFLPTIISVKAFSSVSEVLTVAICSPFLKTATLSDIAMTSFNLCVMMIMDFPSSRMRRRMAKSLSIS